VGRLLHWRSLASLALQLAILTTLVAAFFILPWQVSGFSMAPRISPNEYVLINRFAYRLQPPQRGDIVAFRESDARVFIKRVVGVPGDRIRIEHGAVIVNGVVLNEPYVRYADNRSFSDTVVPAGSIYVLGDNRADSEDSRFFGVISESRIIGRAIAGVWPPSAVSRL
jgi:signal peptidase I